MLLVRSEFSLKILNRIQVHPSIATFGVTDSLRSRLLASRVAAKGLAGERLDSPITEKSDAYNMDLLFQRNSCSIYIKPT